MKQLTIYGIAAMVFVMIACGGTNKQEKEEKQDEILNESQVEEVNRCKH